LARLRKELTIIKGFYQQVPAYRQAADLGLDIKVVTRIYQLPSLKAPGASSTHEEPSCPVSASSQIRPSSNRLAQLSSRRYHSSYPAATQRNAMHSSNGIV